MNATIKIEIINCLSDKLKKYGFRYSKSKEAFIKKENFGALWYTIHFIKYSSQKGFLINPGHHIRYQEIENIYHETSYFNTKDKRNTTTIGGSLENCYHNGAEMYRKYIENESGIEVICKYYFDLFEEIVQSFFFKYNNLESLDLLVNSDPMVNNNFIHPIFRGSKGLIIAFLLNKNITSLTKIYEQFYTSYCDGFYKADFDKLVKNLESK